MTLHTDRRGDCVVVAINGEVDLQNSGELRKELLGCLADRFNLVVDLSRVGYIDSSGVASLIEAYQMARRIRLEFSLAALSGPVLRVLKLARLDEIFVIREQVDAACRGT